MKSLFKYLQFLENMAESLRFVFRERGYTQTNVFEIFKIIRPKQL